MDERSFGGLGRRVGAFALDYALIAAYLVALTGLMLLIGGRFPRLLAAVFSTPLRGELAGFVLVTLPVTLYFALGESSGRQATWGKRRLGLRVGSATGSRLSRGRSLLRSGLKFVPWELSHACIWQVSFAGGEPAPLIVAGFGLVWVLVGANLISLLVSRTRQTLYDRLAGSLVWRD